MNWCPISGGLIARCRHRRHNPVMPLGLKRYQHEGEDHFLTFGCYGREPHLGTPHAKDSFLLSLELTRQSYGFDVLGFVVMPGTFTFSYPSHPLTKRHLQPRFRRWRSPPRAGLPSGPSGREGTMTSMSSCTTKGSRSRATCTATSVKRRLVENPEDWAWSSYRRYLLNESAPVHIRKL